MYINDNNVNIAEDKKVSDKKFLFEYLYDHMVILNIIINKRNVTTIITPFYCLISSFKFL